ncbi:hypothetical protein FE257_006068 [Aspergillus nanangensis]|uniref:Transcription factor domain-containing protein n=1 Tax=Aspergillus nanangensis TaxID=2582783 RepID=A0AAD4CPN6_ASPNN|nr:hypothetical protein FE257_006068 [Aspergillus nanangensis]
MSDFAWFTSESPAVDTAAPFPPCLTSDMELCLDSSVADFLEANFEYSGGWEELITKGRIRQASEAYKTSLWYSVPGQSWANHELTSSLTDETPEALLKELRSSAPPRFNQSARDQLFATLIICAHNKSPECLQTLCSAFPSPALLNTLVHLFLAKHDLKIDSWIHSASCEPNAWNMELMAMIVAASALTTSSPALHRLGTGLRRLLRPLILEKIEGHEANCKLELYQAFLLSLELDLWHGEEDCLHRAGRFASVIATFVREELKDRHPGSINPLSPTNNEESSITEKWIAWIRAESFKRLATRFCVYDNQLSMTLSTRALMPLSDYCPSAPQPRELWLARDHTEWNRMYMAQQDNYVPRIMDLFISMPSIPLNTDFVDSGLAMKVSFHLIGGLITEYQLSTQQQPHTMTQTCREEPSPDSSSSNPSRRKQELKTAITNFDHVFSSHICASNIGHFIVSYLSMTLDVSIKNIEILAGKTGEQESHDMYQIMKDWPHTTEACSAIWHAGQVLRLFKLLDRLTSFQIIMVYHAGLVLFAYSVLSRVNGRAVVLAEGSDTRFYLNDVSSSSRVEEFIRNGVSLEPMLRGDFRGTERVTAPLLTTDAAVEIISEVVLNRSHNCEGLSPRLIHGLVNLLRDLASAIQVAENSHFLNGLEF